MSVSQALFHDALLDPGRPVPEGLFDAEDHPAGRRFDVYRNNVAVSLTEAMHSAFPVIAKLLGKENMDGLSGIYLRAHPPKTPLMMYYGEDFPEFLGGMEQLSHLGYLPDVARLELALRRSYYAADAPALPPEQLGTMAPEDLMAATVALAPSLNLLRSQWPVFDIWRFNTQDDAPKPEAVAQDVVVLRPEFDPQPHPLPPGGSDLIAALSEGRTLGEAYEAALATNPSFDLSALLALLLQGGALTQLNPKG